MCKAEPAFAARAGVKLYGVESVTAEEGEAVLTMSTGGCAKTERSQTASAFARAYA